MSDVAGSSKKCVIEIFKRDDIEHPWGMRMIREHGEPYELMFSPDPIEVRPYGVGAAHEPATAPLLSPFECKHESASFKCNGCGLDFVDVRPAPPLGDSVRASQPPGTARLRFGQWWEQFVKDHPRIKPEHAYEESIALHAWAAAKQFGVPESPQRCECYDREHCVGSFLPKDRYCRYTVPPASALTKGGEHG